ncbi:MAG: ATP-dependent Clp protease proteolytic subunit [Chitinispirillaceae bacterium]|jgi:ATP-dependent Clp protease protease subunit
MGKDQMEGLEKNLKRLMTGSEMEEQFLKRREVFLWGEIDDASAEAIVKRILFFDGQSSEDITIFINSPGGVISSGLAIYDAMQKAKSDIAVVCMGQAASMAALILCAGTKGKRQAWEHARVLIHQPLISGNMFGPASDLQIQAEEMLRIRDNLNEILAEHTGQTIAKIAEDTDRDYFMSAEEAKIYGIIDRVIKKK